MIIYFGFLRLISSITKSNTWLIYFILFLLLFKVKTFKTINFTLSTFYSGSLSTALATSHKFWHIILFYHVLFVIILQRFSMKFYSSLIQEFGRMVLHFRVVKLLVLNSAFLLIVEEFWISFLTFLKFSYLMVLLRVLNEKLQAKSLTPCLFNHNNWVNSSECH